MVNLCLLVNWFFLIFRLRSCLNRKLLKQADIHICQHDRGVRLTAFQLRNLIQGKFCNRVSRSADGKCDQDFVDVKTRIAASKIFCLDFLNRLDCTL